MDKNKEVVPRNLSGDNLRATMEKIPENILQNNSIDEKAPEMQSVFQKVPFTSQAPFADWKNPLYQNACEEASMIMAMGWVKKDNLTRESADKEIKSFSEFEKKKISHSFDTSAEDTALLAREYFNYQDIEASDGVSIKDIKKELAAGNIVLVPADGQRLGNPFYTPPGPETHMLVIVGYDAKTNEFITNDAGTKRGENYRYKENILFSAIWNYPTGNHHITPPDPKMAKKAMIVVKSR